MTRNVPANPFAAIIDRGVESLPARGPIAELEERIQRGQVGAAVIVADVPGSMADLVEDGRRKIDVLQEALDLVREDLPNGVVVAFAGFARVCPDVLPPPAGGTAMHLGLKEARKKTPSQTIVISDGEPDEAGAALREAAMLSGIIHTIYVGRDDNPKAKEFMAALARRFGGRHYSGDIVREPTFLQASLRRLLTHG